MRLVVVVFWSAVVPAAIAASGVNRRLRTLFCHKARHFVQNSRQRRCRMNTTVVEYRFRTLNQSMSYKLTSGDIVVGHRMWFTHTVHSIPISVFNGRYSTWETTNSSWLALAVVSALAAAFGVWGLMDPKSTGIYTAIAVALVTVGAAAPVCLWRHRRLNGVTFVGESNYSVTVIAHAVPTPEFHAFVDALRMQIKSHNESRLSS